MVADPIRCSECGQEHPAQPCRAPRRRNGQWWVLLLILGAGALAAFPSPARLFVWLVAQEVASVSPDTSGWRAEVRREIQQAWWSSAPATIPRRLLSRTLQDGVEAGWLVRGRRTWPRDTPYRMVWGSERDTSALYRTVADVIDSDGILRGRHAPVPPGLIALNARWRDHSFELPLPRGHEVHPLWQLNLWDVDTWADHDPTEPGDLAVDSADGAIAQAALWDVEFVDGVHEIMHPVRHRPLAEWLCVTAERSEYGVEVRVRLSGCPAEDAVALGLRLVVLRGESELAVAEYWFRWDSAGLAGADTLFLPVGQSSSASEEDRAAAWHMMVVGDPIVALRDPDHDLYWSGVEELLLPGPASEASNCDGRNGSPSVK